MENKQSLIGLDLKDLETILVDLGSQKYRVKQLWFWIYNQGVKSFDEMTNIPKDLRLKLAEKYNLERAAVSKELISFDETRKWLLKFDDGNEAETVFIPEEDRGTVCISSQVGCTLTCKFCHTGTQLLVRNLTAREIVAQFMLVKDSLNDWPASKDGRRVTNIVMMGMGEPLYNYDNVSKALRILMDNEGMSLSRRKITLSTSGVVPEIERCGRELGVNLAVSLHATTDALRNEIVPLNKKYNIELLLEACRTYPALKNRGRITFEYVMLKDVNDSLDDAKRLVSLIRNIPSKVNLIPFNTWPDAPYECSDKNTIMKFVNYLHKKRVIATVRSTRGDDIYAACGQLKSLSERKRKSHMH